MSEEQQLERSVLERKDRKELYAIALAMSLNPTQRARKAMMIDQILEAAGVPVGTQSSHEPARVEEAVRSEQPAKAEQQPAIEAAVAPASSRGRRSARARGEQLSLASNGDSLAAATLISEAPVHEAPVGGSNGRGRKREGVNGSDPELEEVALIELDEGRPRAAGTVTEAGSTDTGAVDGRRPANQAGSGASGSGGASGNGSRWQQNGAGAAHETEAGGRRRRRRGRDRERDRPEREMPGFGQEQAYQGEPVAVAGLLDLREEGFGFLRTSGYLPSPRDVYVPVGLVRRLGLRKGDWIEGVSRPAAASEKYPAMLRVDTVCGAPVEEARGRPRFEDLTPLFPDTKLKLEVPGEVSNMTARIVDLLSPIGKGQRGLIVSPPKAGKTTVMKQIAHSIEANNPEVHLMVLLVEERPEEVTDMRRSVKGEVVASTFDRPSEEHTQIAELALERARRLVELGQDVVIILDGITRLARAYNMSQPATGRIMSGGVDSGALYPPRKFFGAARNIEEGGSLTILATALVETGSRMDEVIFEEFKGTGNMELRLDRRLAERRIYPAIDVNASSTRHEELLFDRAQLQQVWKLRRVLNALSSEGSGAPGLELLIDKIKTTRSNDEFLAEVAKSPGV